MMSDEDDLTPEEREAFDRAMRGVKPLKADSKRPSKTTDGCNKAIINSEPRNPTIDQTIHYEIVAASGEQKLWFNRPNVHSNTLKRLKRGQLPVEAELDLHGLFADEAIQQATQFITNCRQQDIRCICLVHGKGLQSASLQAVLKSHLNGYLRAHPDVLAFSSAPPKLGGTGALLVLLKASRRLCGVKT